MNNYATAQPLTTTTMYIAAGAHAFGPHGLLIAVIPMNNYATAQPLTTTTMYIAVIPCIN